MDLVSGIQILIQILSIEAMNRAGDMGLPWQSPTTTANEYDSLGKKLGELSVFISMYYIIYSFNKLI